MSRVKSSEARIATREETMAFYDRLLKEAILPHSDEIAHITSEGDIPVLVYDVMPDGSAEEAARTLGWTGQTSWIREMSRPYARDWARRAYDKVMSRWIEREEVIVMLVTGDGCLLLTMTEKGWGTEPGSTDFERQRVAN